MPRIDFRDVWRENMRIGTKEKEQVKLVEDWNAKHPVIGIDVIVTKDSSTWKKSYIPEGKSEVKTKTRSLAYMLGASGDYIGHTAVIMLGGISGCYALERVREASFQDSDNPYISKVGDLIKQKAPIKDIVHAAKIAVEQKQINKETKP